MSQLVLFDYGTLDTETRTFVQKRTGEIRTLVRRAAQDIIEIGHKLIEVKGRLGHGNFGAWLQAEFGWTDRTARQMMLVTQAFKTENFSDLNMAPSALYLLASPSTPDEARAEALARAEQGERITYTTAREIVQEYKAPAPALAFALPDETEDSNEYEDDDEPDNLRYDPDEDTAYCKYCYVTHDSWSWRGDAWECRLCDHATHDDYMQITDKPPSEAQAAWYNQFAPAEANEADTPETPTNPPAMAVHYSSERVTWNTPRHIVDLVVDTLGQIDLDPCSDSRDAPNIPAFDHYTEQDDGLARPWLGKVYMNPPYGDVIADWVNHLLDQHQQGNVTEAIALVPARTDTQWFRPLWDYPCCFIHGRLRFGGQDSAPFPSVAVYIGNRPIAFAGVFGKVGTTVMRINGSQNL